MKSQAYSTSRIGLVYLVTETLRDDGTTAGIATDKLLALLGEQVGSVPAQIDTYTGVAKCCTTDKMS